MFLKSSCEIGMRLGFRNAEILACLFVHTSLSQFLMYNVQHLSNVQTVKMEHINVSQLVVGVGLL